MGVKKISNNQLTSNFGFFYQYQDLLPSIKDIVTL
ncbi:unnamed protein product, partial [marine sediment metagenome]